MNNQKLTAKKILTIVIVSALGSVGIGLLYLGILFFSLRFTANMTVSWILSLSVIVGIILLCLGYALKTRKRRGTQN